MNKEQAQRYIELLKICKTGSTRAANKALREIAEMLATEYGYAAGVENTDGVTQRRKNFLLAAGFIKADDLIS